MDSTLRTRTATGLVFGFVFLGSLYLGALPFAAIMGLASVLAAFELGRLIETMGWPRPRTLPLFTGVVFLVSLFAVSDRALVPVVLTTWCLLLVWLVRPLVPNGSAQTGLVARVLVPLAGVLYLGLLPSFLVRLQPGPWAGGSGAGAEWILLGVLLVWTLDTAAYLWGTRFGRHPLWPAVSPAKTVEGGVAALIAGVGGALVLRIPLAPDLDWGAAAVFGALTAVVSHLGDLVQSRIKRKAGVKDSGTLFPGHGGVLDRFDALFFVAPLFHYYLGAFAR